MSTLVIFPGRQLTTLIKLAQEKGDELALAVLQQEGVNRPTYREFFRPALEGDGLTPTMVQGVTHVFLEEGYPTVMQQLNELLPLSTRFWIIRHGQDGNFWLENDQ